MNARLRHLTGSLLLLIAIANVGCERVGWPFGDTVMKPVHRFVDQGAGTGTSEYPVASINDDTRLVLAAPAHGIVLWRKQIQVPETGRLSLQGGLGNTLRGASEVVIFPTIYYPDHSRSLPPQVVSTLQLGEQTAVRVDFSVPTDLAGREIQVHVAGYATDLVDLASIRTPEVDIPKDAVLEFAIGHLESELGNDPVDFSVQACDAEDCEQIFEEISDPKGNPHGWRDRRVELSNLGGTHRSFRFEANQTRSEAPYSFPMWANPTIYAPTQRSEAEPNVILLSIDTLRADHLTSYGYHRDTAPFMQEKFAADGIVFESSVAAATLTTPSHMSMFTSLQPTAHGTVDGMSKSLPWNIPTLAELIRAHRIDTGAVTEDGWLGIRHGFGRGFNSYAENRSADIMAPEGQVDVTFEVARRWLEWNRDKRFFLFLHTFQVHYPYAPPEKYRSLFMDSSDPPADEGSPENSKRIADYDQEIRYTDDELRLLFETLETLDLDDKTVFIVTSDHGEAFLEHGALEHGTQMYDEEVRVPLIFWGPGIPSGLRIEVPVAHVDLMPTILEIFGVEPPRFLEGSSLTALMKDESAASRFGKRPVFSESHSPMRLGPGRSLSPVIPPAFGVRLGSRKLARYRTPDGYRYEFYDLRSDPLERKDLFADQPQRASDLVALIEGYEEQSARVRAEVDASQNAGPSTNGPQGVLLDPEQEKKLRALGYLK
jgi:arylsulfatase A-like enzyme